MSDGSALSAADIPAPSAATLVPTLDRTHDRRLHAERAAPSVDVTRDVTPGGDAAGELDRWFAEYRATRDPDLRNRLVLAHLHLADRSARRYTHRGEPIADLLQVSRMALVRAVERFDPDRGVRFEAFASPTILGELRHHFRDNCWVVSVPRRAKDLRSQVFRAAEQIGQHLGRQPTPAEIADALGIDEERVSTTIETNRHFRATSWEAIADAGVRAELPVVAGDAGSTDEDAPTRLDVANLLRGLDERLQRIVVWRFYEECTQREIGERLGIGQVQVSRLLARAMEQLRSRAGGRPELAVLDS